MTTYQYKSLVANLQDILVAKSCGDKGALHEASLARVWQHVKNAEETGMAILTSWRQSLTREDNLSRFAELKSQVRNLGHGFFVVNGHWQESQDPSVPYDQASPEQLVDAVEPALFVPGITREEAHGLGNKYQQDAVLYAGPETKGDVELLFKDGSSMNLGEFSPNTISQGFSELGRGSKSKPKRTFKFEGLSWPVQTRSEAMLAETIKSRLLKLALKP